MSTGIILAIAIPATGILMMRYHKRWLAKINIVVTNRITGLFASWLPRFWHSHARRSKIGESLPDTRERLRRAERIHNRSDLVRGIA